MNTGHVDPDLVRTACEQLDWSGDIAGPVMFGGLSFWAVYNLVLDEHLRRRERGIGAVVDREALQGLLGESYENGLIQGLRPPLRLAGCLVPGQDGGAVTQASMLSGYTPRAVLVPDRENIVELLVDAALLDQGVVVYRGQTVTALSQAGPKVRGHGFDAREWHLLETVYARHAAAIAA